jgi:hypothetical protein
MLSRSSSDPLTMRATTAGHFSPGMPPIPALRAFLFPMDELLPAREGIFLLM